MKKMFIVYLVMFLLSLKGLGLGDELYDPIEVSKEKRAEIAHLIKRFMSMNLKKEELYSIIGDEKRFVNDRKAAVNVIGEIGDLSDIPRLKEMYKEIDGRRFKKGYIRSAHDPDLEVTVEIPRAIADIYTRSKTVDRKEMIKIWVQITIDCIDNKIDDQLLCSGVYHLFEENEYDKDEMIRILEYLDNRKLRASILTIVNYNPCKEALEPIIKVLKESKNDFYSIRYLAVRAIQKIGDKSAIPFLKEIANDKNEHEKVRKAAEKAIEVLNK